jgi:hypothetical protein
MLGAGGGDSERTFDCIVRTRPSVSRKRHRTALFGKHRPKVKGRGVSLASMAKHSGISRLGAIWTLGAVTLAATTGCGGVNEPNAVLRVGSHNLRCPQSDLETTLHRESSQVREYYVGCDFMYTRVLCDKPNATQPTAQCHPAKPQPPCFGGGCFKENPLTFEWEIDETLASSEPARSGAELFSKP